ncbi:hypothetical protein MUO83_07865 [Candidatus Bathyarchaeota archaeon]|nr:hypothetical protein [Candidatus Bathyarchaeota archaeon]
MSNVATVRKEVAILRKALAPKEEPEWAKNARAIKECLENYERVKKESGFYELSPADQMKCEVNLGKDVVRNLARQGLWGPEEAKRIEKDPCWNSDEAKQE